MAKLKSCDRRCFTGRGQEPCAFLLLLTPLDDPEP
jgi:hypothetical protein